MKRELTTWGVAASQKVPSQWAEYRRDQEKRKALSGPCVTVYKKPENKK